MDGFKNIEINNFRGIDHLKIDDFSRVNVFLGQNSSGKTSVLECILPTIENAPRHSTHKKHWKALFALSVDVNKQVFKPLQPIIFYRMSYEQELMQQDIPSRTPQPLTTSAKKTKIYSHLETPLGKTKSEKNPIKDPDHTHSPHWNLDSEYLEPPKVFLQTY